MNENKEILEAASAAMAEIIPSKSKERYENTYLSFQNWCNSKKVIQITEDVMLAYFMEKSKCYKPSTLWSTYSMIKAMLSIEKNVNLKDFTKLIAFLKRKSAGFQAKKSRVFTRSEIETFLLNAPDDEFLMMKV